LNQKPKDGDKIYSLHEPEVYCMSKGKEHKKYEFGAKATVVVGKNKGVILGAYSLPKNDYDGHALEPTLEQVDMRNEKRKRDFGDGQRLSHESGI
jgi:IS5 family transposase